MIQQEQERTLSVYNQIKKHRENPAIGSHDYYFTSLNTSFCPAQLPYIDTHGTISNSWKTGEGKFFIPNGSVRSNHQRIPERTFIPVILFVSSLDGRGVLNHLIASEKVFVAGICTDNPTDKNSQINLNKRFWKDFDVRERQRMEEGIILDALNAGIPVYLGKVKSEQFYKSYLPEMFSYARLICNLDNHCNFLGVMCTFGQILNNKIVDDFFGYYGIINIHPSDLRSNNGMGFTSTIIETATDGKVPIAYHYANPKKIDDSSGLILQTKPLIPVINDHGNPLTDKEFEQFTGKGSALPGLDYLLSVTIENNPRFVVNGKIKDLGCFVDLHTIKHLNSLGLLKQYQ